MTEPQMVRVDILAQSFQPWNALDQWHDAAPAHAVFLGSVRSEAHDGQPLDYLEISHYPGLSERCIKEEAERLLRHHKADAVMVLHRVGLLPPGEPIVLVAVSADRRGAAQRCCQAVLEMLKHEAPFWKREWRSDGSSEWLTDNTPL